MRVGQDDIFGLQRGRSGVVESQTMEVDGVIADGSWKTDAPLGTQGTVGRVQQAAQRHHFMVHITCKQSWSLKHLTDHCCSR